MDHITMTRKLCFRRLSTACNPKKFELLALAALLPALSPKKFELLANVV
jgi:hypothetical protein